MNRKNLFIVIAVTAGSVGGGFLGAMAFQAERESQSWTEHNPVVQTRSESLAGISTSTDFSAAAESAVHSVVHVKTSVEQGYTMSPFNPFHDFFFGFGERQIPEMTPRIVQGSGSGVIISEDGYIVTNNHVVDKAKEVKVSLNDGRDFTAEVIGTDPTTDLAVLKIDAKKLPALPFGNSDDVKLGEWVLAVGNPFNLTSTVTAGIISAKGRSINIIDNQSAIEAFIQTDAAVNPGNSGGALINTSGELIGINTAISTRSGSYEGYSFAVPANIARKVVDDMLRFGVVQRAYLGVSIADVTPELAKEMKLDATQGVYLSEVVDNGAAKKAGMEKGDVIVGAGGKTIKRSSELLEVIGSRRPGDKLDVTVLRDGKSKTFNVTLRNREGNTDVVKKEDLEEMQTLGATFEALSQEDRGRYGLRSGVKIIDVGNGKLKEAGVPNGFILIKLNNSPVSSQDDVRKILGQLNPGDGVLLQGYRPDGRPDYFAFGL
jgi:Do/DeqQ family serine protease